MRFEPPAITIVTDAYTGPSSNTGTVFSSCMLNGEEIKTYANYISTGLDAGEHLAAATSAIRRLKEKVVRHLIDVPIIGGHADCGNASEFTPKAGTEFIGKTVRLKSGGLTMTAAALADDGGIVCVWSDVRGVWRQSIPMAALEIAEFSSRDGWQAQDGATAYAARDLQAAGAYAAYTKASEPQGAGKVAP